MPTSCNARTKLLPQRRGGVLALTLRRSVRELLRALCHAGYTSRVFVQMWDRAAVHTRVESPMARPFRCTRADKRPITPCTSRLRAPCSTPLQKRSRSCMPLASPCPLPPVSLRYYQASMCTNDSKLQHSSWTTQTHTSAHFRIQQYFGRLLSESKRIAATYRRDQEACEDKVLPCRPHATPGPSSCPNGGGDLARTPRRSMRERCMCCATQVALVHLARFFVHM